MAAIINVGSGRSHWTVARVVVHALEAPPDVNVFDALLLPTAQSPW